MEEEKNQLTKDFFDPTLGVYVLPEAQMYVNDKGNSFAVRNGKVIGRDASYQIPKTTVTAFSKQTRDKLKVLGIDVDNQQDLEKLQNHYDKDGNIDWSSFDISSQQYKQMYDIDHPYKPRQYSGMDYFNAITGGVFNLLNPSQIVGNVSNIVQGKSNWRDEFVLGNSGVVPDKVARKHPYLAAGTNLLFDAAALGGKSLYQKGTNTLVRKPNRITIHNSRTFTSTPYEGNGPAKRFIPDTNNIFKYNADLEVSLYDKEVQDLIKNFQKTKDLKALEASVNTLNPAQQEQLTNYIKTYKFSGIKVPYYTDIYKLLEDKPLINEVFEQAPIDNQFDVLNLEGGLLDIGDDYALLVKDPAQRIHEAEHVLQRRRFFSETEGPYMQKQEDMLQKAYPHSENGITEAKVTVEKGAVNQQLRENIINNFKNKTGRYPTLKELLSEINNISDKELLKLLRKNTNAYGTEYAENKPNLKLIRKALQKVGVAAGVAYTQTTKGED